MKIQYTTGNETFLGDELLLKDYKNLIKAIYGDEIDEQLFILNFFEILSIVFNKPFDFFKTLNIEQLFLLLIQIRLHSLGNTCSIRIKDEDQNTKVELNLERLKDEMVEYIQQWNKAEIICNEAVKVSLSLPQFSRLTNNLLTADGYLSLVEKIVINLNENDTKTLNVKNDYEAKKALDCLPLITTKNIMEYHKRYIDFVDNVNFLQYYDGTKGHNLGFVPTISNLIWYCKLFFAESLDVFFNNFYYLTKLGNFNPSYLENCCTPGEYVFFTKKLEGDLKPAPSENLTTDPDTQM